MALYLPKYNLLFFHIYKTAGTSVRYAFHYVDPGYEERGSLHADVSELQDQIEGKNLMSIVRNPYDWVFSLYQYSLYHKSHPFNSFAVTHTFDQFTDWYVKNLERLNETNVNGKLQSQTEYLSMNGKIMIPNIFKMENLEVELNQYFKDYFRLTKPIRLDHKNVTPYEKLNPNNFSRETKDLINERFKSDFINFNYEML